MNQEMQEFAREDSEERNHRLANMEMAFGLLCKYFPSHYLVRRIIFIYKNIPLSNKSPSNVRLQIFILQVY